MAPILTYMNKGLLILTATILVVLILNIVMLKIAKLTDSKKKLFQKYYYAVFGTYLVISSSIPLFENQTWGWLQSAQFVLGLISILFSILIHRKK